ncbi:hypothetical protein [Clostridium ganghwense]|uniref:DUF11 domain-containing protein n=1 Tax=Clostridium ganghwense TaxID=312089 RepID=A0ABT4CS69_9CLOT|nr:hypothetical protein [Clostridium ganghwense]MCY6371900.1 hypothetical protein [Clostridium ganghwense]
MFDTTTYSTRDKISVPINKPNLIITKKVTGPNINSINFGEIYNYTVEITNTNTLGTEADAFDFNLIATLSHYLILNINSVVVSGTGFFKAEKIEADKIIVPILKLGSGDNITLSYSVKIKNNIIPNIGIVTTAYNTAPYYKTFNSNKFQPIDITRNKKFTLRTGNIIKKM